MMKWLLGLTLLFFLVDADADASKKKSLKVFQNYLQQSQKQYAKTQDLLINRGESHLKEHTISSERLSLAEMLPLTYKELPGFCKTYANKILKYYNVANPKQLAALKSKVFPSYNKMIVEQCNLVMNNKK